MFGLSSNLRSAKEALEYVNKRMTIGSSNRTESSLEAKKCVPLMKSKDPGLKDAAAGIREMAARAEEWRCGNCGELAAVAFMFLVSRGKGPLDFISFAPHKDHAFVMIGRADGRIQDPFSWGEETVICDPWDRKAYWNETSKTATAYAATELDHKMYCRPIFPHWFTLLHRVELVLEREQPNLAMA